jgi:hypothetical protein
MLAALIGRNGKNAITFSELGEALDEQLVQLL